MKGTILAILVAASSLAQEELREGEKLFVSHCSRCHGIGGTGGEGPSLVRARLRHASDDEALFAIVQNGIEGTDMPATWQISENEIRRIVGYVKTLGRVEEVSLPGDRERGKALFEGRGACSPCHAVRGEGGILGPDLTEVGLRRGASFLRESLLHPGSVVAEEYRVVEASTSGGLEIRGARVNEDSFTIQIRDQSGRFHSLEKRELASLEKKPEESLMPSYASEMTEQELEDLVAYLASLRGEP